MTADADEKHDSCQFYNQSSRHVFEGLLIHVISHYLSSMRKVLLSNLRSNNLGNAYWCHGRRLAPFEDRLRVLPGRPTKQPRRVTLQILIEKRQCVSIHD